MKTIPLIDLFSHHKDIQGELKAAVNRVIDSQRFVLGESVADLEKQMAKYTQSRHAIGVASGSDALYLALVALGIGPGDEVITTALTFFATAGSISRIGARPIFVDVEPSTLNINPDLIEAKITPKTKAIVPVHLFGLMCEMDSIMRIARKHSLYVIEDAAQAIGAKYHGKPAGSIGTVGCFSFYPTKNLGGAGDGGMIVTSSKALATKIRRLRDHGATKKYYHGLPGTNSRLDEMQAAFLLVKLKRLDAWNQKRREHATTYHKGLEPLPIQLPQTSNGRLHTYHLYSILTSKRNALKKFLKTKGIGTDVYYPLALHLQPCYRSLGGKKGDFPVAEKATSRVLALPMYPELPEKSKNRIIKSVQTFFKRQ